MYGEVDLPEGALAHDLPDLIEVRARGRRILRFLKGQADDTRQLHILTRARAQIRIT